MSAPSPTPRKRTRVGPPPPPPAPPRAVVELVELVERHLAELAEVHRPLVITPELCRECIQTYPCHTRVMIDEALAAVRS